MDARLSLSDLINIFDVACVGSIDENRPIRFDHPYDHDDRKEDMNANQK